MYVIKSKKLWQYELPIFVILLAELLFRLPGINEMNDWCTTPYAFDYSFGFQSRYFIGSLFKVFLSPISVYRLYVFILISTLVLIGLFSLFLGQILRKSTEDSKNGVVYWIALLLAGPASPAFLFYWGNYGRLDLYLLGVMILSLLAASHKQLRFIVPILVFIGMAIHQVFIFTYCPVILAALFYEAFKEHNAVKDKWGKALLYVAIGVATAAFMYFQFFTETIKFETSEAVVMTLNQQSNIPISQKMIEFEYFKSIKDHIGEFVMVNLNNRVAIGAVVLALMSPVILLIALFWKSVIAKAQRKRWAVFLSLMPLATVPAFILTIDWGRWYASIFITTAFLALYLYSRGDIGAILFFTKLKQWTEKHYMAALGLLLALVALNKFEAANILTAASKIIRFLIIQ